MLPKSNRLNIRTYFGEIRGTGKKLSSPYFSFYYRLSESGSTPQISCVISKKVAKSAVKRNRMRRLLNTAAKSHLDKINPSLQGLFFVYKDFSHLKSQDLSEVIKNVLDSGGLLDHHHD